MYRDIDYVIARNIEAMQSVVQGEAEVSDVPAFERVLKRGPVRHFRIDEIAQIAYDGILCDIGSLVPEEGRVEGVGVDSQNQQSQ